MPEDEFFGTGSGFGEEPESSEDESNERIRSFSTENDSIFSITTISSNTGNISNEQDIDVILEDVRRY